MATRQVATQAATCLSRLCSYNASAITDLPTSIAAVQQASCDHVRVSRCTLPQQESCQSASSGSSTGTAVLAGLLAAGGIVSATADSQPPWASNPFSAHRPTTLAQSSGQHIRTAAEQDAPVSMLLREDPTSASAVALATPVTLLLGVATPLGPAALSALAAAGAHTLQQQRSLGQYTLPSWEIATLARGVALLAGPGVQALAPELIYELKAVLSEACIATSSNWQLIDLISLAWSLSVICGGLSAGELSSLTTRLNRQPDADWDEGSRLLMLDALLLTTAAISGPGACAANEPRVSKAAFESAVQPLTSRVREALLSAYDRYVPLEPHISGPLFVLLHTVMGVHKYSSSSQLQQSSTNRSWFGFSTQQAQHTVQPSPAMSLLFGQGWPSVSAMTAAQKLLAAGSAAGAHEVARLERDCHYHYRHDEALDVRQQSANQAAHLLSHLLGPGAVLRPHDIDIALPRQHLALIFTDDNFPYQRVNPSAGSSPLPAMNLDIGSTAVTRTCREAFSPAARYSTAASAGSAAAHDTMIRKLGWKLRRVSMSEWSDVVTFIQPTATQQQQQGGNRAPVIDKSPAATAKVNSWLDSCLR